MDIRNLLERVGAGSVEIIAKIENQQGIDNIDEIIEAADGIMVARGDLGVEVPSYQVPMLQKEIIGAAGRRERTSLWPRRCWIP